jgi:hypothetical protein
VLADGSLVFGYGSGMDVAGRLLLRISRAEKGMMARQIMLPTVPATAFTTIL